jgi:hypothetical protein
VTVVDGCHRSEAVNITQGRILKGVDKWSDLAHIKVACFVCHQHRLDDGEDLLAIHELVSATSCLSPRTPPTCIVGVTCFIRRTLDSCARKCQVGACVLPAKCTDRILQIL